MLHEPGTLILLFVSLALMLGAATRHLLKGTPVPYTVALLLLGLGLGLGQRSGLLEGIWPMAGESIQLISEIDPHLILFLFLPTLIFESAFAMEVHLFRRTFGQIALLAVPGLIVCTLLTAVLAKTAFPWDWSWSVALMFGALISATDPVAVVALLKEQSSRKRLETLIEGESLLNDGTAIVLFTLFYGMVVAGAGEQGFSLLHTVGSFTWVVSLGLIIGVVLGIFALIWIGRIFNDAMIEITVTVACAYLVFFIAEELFHVSGVVGIVALALLFASVGRTRISPEVGGFLHHFWELMAYVANTLIFLLVGIVIADRVQFPTMEACAVLGLLYVCALLIRGGTIAMFSPLLGRIGIGINREKALVLAWGGLRGAVALALALVVAQDPAIPNEIGDMILFLCAGMVVLTILINGSTMPILFRKLGLDHLPPAKQATIDKARVSVREALEKLLPELQANQFLQQVDWEHVHASTALGSKTSLAETDTATEDRDYATAYRRRLLEAERKNYWTQYQQGLLGAAAANKLVEAVEHALDGEPVIGPRPELFRLWETPALLATVYRMPGVRRFAIPASFDRMARGYDAARGFIKAQDEISGYISQLAPTAEAAETVRQEILQNKRDTFLRIEQLRDTFPEILSALETQAAVRVLLNRERAVINELVSAGVLDAPEAERLTDAVETRMHELRKVPLERRSPESEQVLRQAGWTKGLSDAAVARLAGSATARIHGAGEMLVRAGHTGQALLIIGRGSVEVLRHTASGEEVEEVLGAGSVIGARSLITGSFDHSIKAGTPVESFWLDADELRAVMKENPFLVDNLTGTMGPAAS